MATTSHQYIANAHVFVAERADGPPPSHLLLMLHGAEGHPREILPIGLMLDRDETCLVVAPAGPVDTGNQNRSWFDIFSDPGDADGIDSAAAQLTEIIDDICDRYEIVRDRVIVFGFSQGACMAVGLAFGPKGTAVKGVGCLSGWLPENAIDEYDLSSRQSTRVLAQHGYQDDAVPMVSGAQVPKFLERSGIEMRFEKYSIGHRMTPETIAAAGNWVSAVTRNQEMKIEGLTL